MDRHASIAPAPAADEHEVPVVLGTGGPPFWEEWRGILPDEEIEFVRVIFEDFCGSWD
ncbi:MAG TPA: hypothetical protein VKB03_10095 [Conexibacter sp.]|nr:hypothetical protein [Conexibacter sp.]